MLGKSLEHHPGVAELLRRGHAHGTAGRAFTASHTGTSGRPRDDMVEHWQNEEVGEHAEAHPPRQYV